MSTNISTRQTLEQGRADFAFQRALAGYSSHKKEYSQLVKKVPMLIKTNGLGATLAFMFSKGKALGKILLDIEEWIKNPENRKTSAIYDRTHGDRLVRKVTNLDSSEYRIVTIEVLAYLNWLRRFSEGITKENESPIK